MQSGEMGAVRIGTRVRVNDKFPYPCNYVGREGAVTKLPAWHREEWIEVTLDSDDKVNHPLRGHRSYFDLVDKPKSQATDSPL